MHDRHDHVRSLDQQYQVVEPLLPVRERRFRYSGRKQLPDREALQGIATKPGRYSQAWKKPIAN